MIKQFMFFCIGSLVALIGITVIDQNFQSGIEKKLDSLSVATGYHYVEPSKTDGHYEKDDTELNGIVSGTIHCDVPYCSHFIASTGMDFNKSDSGDPLDSIKYQLTKTWYIEGQRFQNSDEFKDIKSCQSSKDEWLGLTKKVSGLASSTAVCMPE